MIAKLEAYGFHKDAIKLLHSYLTDRKQRVKVGSAYSSWRDVLRGVPQGSVLGPLLFNIFINDLLLFIEKCSISNFADDNTLYKCGFELRDVITALEDDLTVIQKWFSDNSMIANPSKYQFMILGAKLRYKLKLQIGNKTVIAVKQVKLLGIIIDDKLKFHNHIRTICTKAGNRANALNRICHILDTHESMLLFNTFFDSTFNYCPLVWAFCTKKIK